MKSIRESLKFFKKASRRLHDMTKLSAESGPSKPKKDAKQTSTSSTDKEQEGLDSIPPPPRSTKDVVYKMGKERSNLKIRSDIDGTLDSEKLPMNNPIEATVTRNIEQADESKKRMNLLATLMVPSAETKNPEEGVL